MVRNWNYCLEQARCDWICIIHDDDTLAPGGVEVLRRACEFADQPALILPTERQAECDDSFRYRFWSPGAWSVLHCPRIPSGAVIHREIIQELGVFNPKFCYSADLEYFPRIAAHFPVVIIESPLAIRYELHDSNYQIKTWRETDFYTQLEEIQRSIISYAGIKGAVAESLVQQRLTSLLEYVIREADRRGDQILVRQYAQLLGKRIQTGSWAHFLNLLRSLKQVFRRYLSEQRLNISHESAANIGHYSDFQQWSKNRSHGRFGPLATKRPVRISCHRRRLDRSNRSAWKL